MALALLVGDCRPLIPAELVNAGHNAVCVRTSKEAWDWLLPTDRTDAACDVGTGVAVIGADVSDAERASLIRWFEEETPLLPVLVLAHRNAQHPSAYAHYSINDPSDAALRAVAELLNGIDRNC